MSGSAAERRAQGLPDHVTDPVILARLAALLVPPVVAKSRRARTNKKASTVGDTSAGASMSEVGHGHPSPTD